MTSDISHKTTLEKMAAGKYMNQNAFDYLISTTDFSAHKPTVEALRLMYVVGLERSAAMEQAGVETSGLTRAIKRFNTAVKDHIEKLGYVHNDYVLTEPFSALAKLGEFITLNHSIPESKKERIDKLAKELIVELGDIYSDK